KRPAPQPKQVTPVVRPEEGLYKQGIQYFEGAHYEDAIASFKKLIADYPQSSYTDVAYTYTIQSMVKLELYSDASDMWAKFKVAYPDSPLGASLAKEIQNAKLVSSARTPAIDVSADNANPFASMAKDAQTVDMNSTSTSKNSSSPVPPPTTLRGRSNDSTAANSSTSVPPPTGLKYPEPPGAKGKNESKRDYDARTAAAPIPPDVAGTGNNRTQSQGSNVPAPTALKNKVDDESSAGVTRSRRVENNTAPSALPATIVQVQV